MPLSDLTPFRTRRQFDRRHGRREALRPAAAVLGVLAALAAGLSACGEPEPRTQGVYLLMDAAGARPGEREALRQVVEAVLGRLEAGDSFAVARLGPGRFDENDVIARATFAARPDLASRAKRHLRERVAVFLDGAAPAVGAAPGTAPGTAPATTSTTGIAETDIAGAVRRAAADLKRLRAGRKVILIYSDLAGTPTDATPRPVPRAIARDIPRHIPGALDGIAGVEVIVLDLAEPRPYSVDARAYSKRLAAWRARVEAGGGRWRVIDDLDRLGPEFPG